ncbi:MAG: AAA family ATPase, partial [bacterium]|nr:AAA family ATPase [bacterium]
RSFGMTSRGNERLAEALRKSCLAPDELLLKVGAAVMFVKNNFEEGVVNGTLGTVVGFDASGSPQVKTKNAGVVVATPDSWAIKNDSGKVIAEITQVPLRLAWAMTIHKSQGMSMDAAEIDLSGAFEPGMGYVALSRVRSLSGLRLLGLNETALMVHDRVASFDQRLEELSDKHHEEFNTLSADERKEHHNSFIHKSGGRIDNLKSVINSQKPEPGGYDEIRQTYPSAYKPWRQEDDDDLRNAFKKNQNIKTLSALLGRKPGGIRARLKKLELID